MKRQRVGLRLLAVVAAIAVASAACSGGGSEDTAAGAVDAADPEGVIRVGYELVLQSVGGFELDPAAEPSSANDALLYLIYGRLLRPTADGGLEPDLAESATIVDANTIEVVVRDGVTFHDGTPFDAAAVEAGLERTIVKPDTDFSRPVGAGPFTVEEYQPEQSLTLSKYDDYWDAESITLGGIEFTHIASSQQQSGISALRAGQLDLAITEAGQLAGLSGNIEPLITPNPNQTVAMQVCKSDGPLADADVRRAINMGIDREAISEGVYQGTAQPSTQLWPEGHRFHNPDIADELAYDPEAARALLEEAGYADGFEFDLYVVPALGLPESAEVIQQQLAEIGVTVNVTPTTNYVADFLTPQRPGAGLIPGNQPGRKKLTQWVGELIGNACHYDDPELNRLTEELAAVSDSSDEAVNMWHQIDEHVVSEALGVFVLFRPVIAAYDSDRLGEVAVWPTGDVVVPDPRATSVRAD